VFLRKSAPGYGHIAAGINERWKRVSSILNDDAYRTRVLANRADLASIELLFLGVGEFRAGREPVSGVSASLTGAFSWRNELR